MYVTRPLSLYKCSPEAIREQPPRGSGFLVIQDDDDEEGDRLQAMRSSISRGQPLLKGLPFPQDRELIAYYTTTTMLGTIPVTSHVLNPAHFIPVIDQPLSSNRYYVVIGQGEDQGLVSTCSTRLNMGTSFFFWKYIKDVKPIAFERNNECQQVEIVLNAGYSQGTFHAKSVAPDGFPQSFLRVQPWHIYRSTEHIYPLSQADGIDEAIRDTMPSKSFPGASSPHVLIGKWYCPYIFVREDEMPIKDQVERSMFYKMTLEQFWEEINAWDNSFKRENIVDAVKRIEPERSSLHLHGEEAVEGRELDGVWWFRSTERGSGVGLEAVIVEKMKREEESGGWVEGKKEMMGMLQESIREWKKFRCFVLVERFALRRMDGTLILTYDFKHINKVMSK